MSESISSSKFLTLLLILTACRHESSDRSPAMRVLDNGLRVIVVDDPASTVVSAVVSIHSGSADEDSSESGAAHFLEHVILFRGTEHRTGEAVLDSMRHTGAYFNGHTAHDWTTFEINTPPVTFTRALTLLHEMLFYPRIDVAGVDVERHAILEELQRYEDHPVNKAYAMAQPLLFGDHPYRQPVIGTRDALRTLHVERILSFYRRNYVPNNMSVVVTGNVRLEKAVEWIKNIFIEPSGPAVAPDRPTMTMNESKQDSFTVADVRQAVVMWSAIGPAVSDESMAAVDVLTYILAEGENSRLHDQLRTQTNWANEVHVDVNKRADASVIFIYAGVNSHHVDRVTAAVPALLDSLTRRVPLDHEIERARYQLKTAFELEMERSLARSVALAQYDAMVDFSHVNRYRRQLDDLTSDDIADAARKYFTPGRFRLTAVLPRRP
jgi:predicted Zn-dependent peptidase